MKAVPIVHDGDGFNPVRRTSEDGTATENSLVHILEKCEFRSDEETQIRAPVYRLAGVPFASPGNLITITGQPKTGKSALLAALISSALVSNESSSTLKFNAENNDKGAVLLFDTEQDRARHAELRRIIARRAGHTTLPNHFRSYCVKGLDPKFLLPLVAYTLAINRRSYGKIHSVMIDGVGDFVTDPNSASECFSLISELERLATDYDTVVTCVLHLNPGNGFSSGTKSRGHLGSQLERKVETEIRLRRDSDGATSYWTQFARGESISEQVGLRFAWNAERGFHVEEPNKRDSKRYKRFELLVNDAKAVFGEKHLSHGTAITEMMAQFGITKKGAEARFTRLAKVRVIKKQGDAWRILSGDEILECEI